MTFLRILSIITAIGFISGCGDSLKSPKVEEKRVGVVGELLDYEVSSLNKFAPHSGFGLDSIFQKAKAEDKLVLLDFTGFAAVNARYFENRVWCDRSIYPILKNKFIIASLFCDVILPMPYGDSITVGAHWRQYQERKYGKATQPMYDIVNWQNKSMVDTFATYQSHGEPELFKTWLEEGLTNFKQ